MTAGIYLITNTVTSDRYMDQRGHLTRNLRF